MLALIPIPMMLCAFAILFDDAQKSGQISVSTAITVTLAVVVVYCAKRILELNDRIQNLEIRYSTTKTPKEDRIPAPIVAAITAAVVSTYGPTARIVDMQSIIEERRAWSLEGRRIIFSSHNVR